MAYTYAKLAAFQKCPGSYKFAKDGAPIKHSAHMNVGKLFHTFAALYGKHCVNSKRLTDTSMVPKFMQDAIKQVDMESAKNGGSYCTVEEQEDALALAEQWAEGAFFEPAHDHSFETPLGQFCPFEIGSARWLGDQHDVDARVDHSEYHPDRASTIIVTTYKAGWKVDLDVLQADLFAFILMGRNYNVYQVICKFDFVRYGVTKEKVYTLDDKPALTEKFRSLVAQVSTATDFPCRPGAHCMTCNYAHICAAKATPIGAIASLEEAKSAVENISLLERDIAMAKAALREYTDIYGPVTHNGVKWGTHVSESQRIEDIQAFLKSAACLGEDPFKYLSINQVKAKKLFKKLPDLITTTRKTAFRGKTAGEGDEE